MNLSFSEGMVVWDCSRYASVHPTVYGSFIEVQLPMNMYEPLRRFYEEYKIVETILLPPVQIFGGPYRSFTQVNFRNL
jgi:hypothetical protein